MDIFLVALEGPSVQAWANIRATWPQHHYIISDHLAVIAITGIVVSQQIADAIGLVLGQEPNGFVVKLEHYAGTGRTPVVEWLNTAQGLKTQSL